MDTLPLAGKIALVTGSARRLGAQIVRELHGLGARVFIHYRNSAGAATELQRQLCELRADSAFVVRADLDEVQSYAAMIDTVVGSAGGLDILVNNASCYFPGELGSIDQEHWDTLMNSNVRAPFFLAQAAAPHLRKRNGCIINLVDIHALRPNAYYPVYSMAKAANAMMVKSLAREMAPEVRVNGVAPGAILWPDDQDGGYDQADILNRIPLGRAGDPKDISRTVAFLAQSPYITGQIIPVDGGRTVQQ